jgi:7-cyano-7-deazaguanine synthase
MYLMNQQVVVLLSGGIDSSTCAAIGVHTFGGGAITGLSVAYGQKHSTELNAAARIAERLGLSNHIVVDLSGDIFNGSSSVLLGGSSEVPPMTYSQIEKSFKVSPTYVPFRNGLLLSIAAIIALRIKAPYIFYGAHLEDRYSCAYPDCTPEFNGAMACAINMGTYHEVKIVTPLQWMIKTEVVARAIELGVPLGDTYSCYRGGMAHCGVCSTCVERINAFKENGAIDPAEYMIDIDWR